MTMPSASAASTTPTIRQRPGWAITALTPRLRHSHAVMANTASGVTKRNDIYPMANTLRLTICNSDKSMLTELPPCSRPSNAGESKIMASPMA